MVIKNAWEQKLEKTLTKGDQCWILCGGKTRETYNNQIQWHSFGLGCEQQKLTQQFHYHALRTENNDRLNNSVIIESTSIERKIAIYILYTLDSASTVAVEDTKFGKGRITFCR